jgi:hypothetical protein
MELNMQVLGLPKIMELFGGSCIYIMRAKISQKGHGAI